MPTFKKIPQKEKEIGAIAIQHYAIFCKGLLKAGRVMTMLCNAEKKKSIPLVGYVRLKGEKIFYCRYGFINDPDIYEPLKNDIKK